MRARILDAAQAEFMEAGFAGASSNRILERFGGSKPTMFRHFPTKRALFEAVVARIASRWSEAVDLSALDPASPREWLIGFGIHAATWILSEENLFVGRMAIAEGHLFPEVSETYRALAVDPLAAALAARLAAWTQGGVLTCTMADRDAEHFFDLALSGLVSRSLYRVIGPPDSAAIALHVTSCVTLFLEGRQPR